MLQIELREVGLETEERARLSFFRSARRGFICLTVKRSHLMALQVPDDKGERGDDFWRRDGADATEILVALGHAHEDRRLLLHGLRIGFFDFRVGFYGDVVALQLAIEGGAADAEHFAGKGLVAVGLFEHAEDGHAFHLG